MYNDDIDCEMTGPQETDACLPSEMTDDQWLDQVEREAWDALFQEVDGLVELLDEWEAAHPTCDDCPNAGCDDCFAEECNRLFEQTQDFGDDEDPESDS